MARARAVFSAAGTLVRYRESVAAARWRDGADVGRVQAIARNATKHIWARGMASEPVSFHLARAKQARLRVLGDEGAPQLASAAHVFGAGRRLPLTMQRGDDAV